MPVSKYDPIPEPAANVESLQRSVEALKNTVERLAGLNPKILEAIPTRNFVQRETPTAYVTGDTWTRPALLAGEVPVFSVWMGEKWVIVNS